MTQTAVVGTGSWGTTLAVLLARNGHDVRMLARDDEVAAALNRDRENRRFAPGVALPNEISATSSPEEALQNTDLLVMAVPSSSIRESTSRIRDAIGSHCTVVSGTKGLESLSGKRMTEVVISELSGRWDGQICALSGPNLAKEVIMGLPSTAVVAGVSENAVEEVQAAFSSHNFRVYTNQDVVGVELGGALKNIIAIGAGICDGRKLGANAKAAFVTRGLLEIARLGVAAGADPMTLAGLAGMGDMIATCYSELSRNRRVGEQLAQGLTLNQVRHVMKNVAEGIDTTAAALQLSERLSVDMPITQATHSILFKGTSLESVISDLLGRRLTPELTGLDRKGKD